MQIQNTRHHFSTFISTSNWYIINCKNNHCKSLKNVKVPENVTEILSHAFSGCTNLSIVELPSSLKKMEWSVFESCDNMDALISNSIVPPIIRVPNSSCHSPFSDAVTTGCLLVPAESIDDYQNSAYWQDWKNITPLVPMTDIKFNEVSYNFEVGENELLKVNVSPSNATVTYCDWISSDPTIASVDKNGVVTAIQKGTVTITATSMFYSDVSATCEVTVLPKKCTITYYVDDSICQVDTIEESSEITLPAAPTKEGYTFTGWEGFPADGIMPGCNLEVKAMWEVNSYKISYMVDGNEYKTISIKYGEEITPVEEPTKEGYTFIEWEGLPSTMPANDVTVTGTFTINQYKVTFISDGEVISETTQDFGSAITKPEDPAKEGYTFTGWDSEVATAVPSHDLTYTAQFSVNYYNVLYYVDDKLIHSESVAYGEPFTLWDYVPTDPSQIFNGCDGTIYDTMPAHDIIYSAIVTVDGIESITASGLPDGAKVYTLSGKQMNTMHSGFYIVRMPDGTTKKLYLK